MERMLLPLLLLAAALERQVGRERILDVDGQEGETDGEDKRGEFACRRVAQVVSSADGECREEERRVRRRDSRFSPLSHPLRSRDSAFLSTVTTRRLMSALPLTMRSPLGLKAKQVEGKAWASLSVHTGCSVRVLRR